MKLSTVSKANRLLVISYGMSRCINISTLHSLILGHIRGPIERFDRPPYHPTMARFWRLSTIAASFLMLFASVSGASAMTSPSRQQIYDSWRVVRGWIDGAAAPKAWTPPPGVAPWSAVVILRLRGRVVGVGEAHDDSSLLHAATRAIADAGTRLPALAEGSSPPTWRLITLELELGERPTPVIGTDYAQAGGEVDPAREGLAVRRGDEWTLAHPSVLQALDAAGAPEQTFLSLVMQHGLPARELSEIPASERVGLSKFEVQRVVQPTPDSGPALVHRGLRLVPNPTPGNSPTLARASAASIASWLERSLIEAPAASQWPPSTPSPASSPPPSEQSASLAALGLRGDYLPAEGRDEPLAARPAEQALSAYALARFASLAGSASADTIEAASARQCAKTILAGLDTVAEIELDPLADPKALAWIVLAADALDATLDDTKGDPTTDSTKSARLVLNARGLISKQVAADGTHINGDLLEQAVTAAALTTLERAGHGVIPRDQLIAIVDDLWKSPPRAQFVGVLDWLIIADRNLGVIPEAHASLARAARIAISRVQLGMPGSSDASPSERVSADLAGAFSLAGVGGRGASGQSARPGHALALMLADPVLTPVGERYRARAMQIALVRFLTQLIYDEVACYLCPDPRRALGAVRNAPWDSEVAVAGNAMALLCLSESASAIERINAQLPSVETGATSAPQRGTP